MRNNYEPASNVNINASKKFVPNRCMRLLARRYDLTKTGYKYVEIGCNLTSGHPNVEIAVGDVNKMEIVFDIECWRAFMRCVETINHFFNENNNPQEAAAAAAIVVKPDTIKIEFKLMKSHKVLHIVQNNNLRLIMMKSTVYNLLNLNNCIECVYKDVSEVTPYMSEKLKIYGEIANVKNNVYDILNNDVYESKSIIDCELFTLYMMMNKK